MNNIVFVQLSTCWFVKENYFCLGILSHVLHSFLLKNFHQKIEYFVWTCFCLLSHFRNTFNPPFGDVCSHTSDTFTSQLFLQCFSLSYKYSFNFSRLSFIFSSNFLSLRYIYVIHRFKDFFRRWNISNLSAFDSKTSCFHFGSYFLYDCICNMGLTLKQLIQS